MSFLEGKYRIRHGSREKGFTLIELLIVVAIIGVLAAVIMISLSQASSKSKNASRITSIKSIPAALEAYMDRYNQYPVSDSDGCGGWDIGNKDHVFIPSLAALLGQTVPVDSTKSGSCDGFFYYRYPAGSSGCDASKGAFYVLGTKLDGGNDPSSPGWSCPGRNWQGELQWVTGRFEAD